MHRNDLIALSRLRSREARILLEAGEFPGAYHLAGYAVECALKACIAPRFRRHDIPDRRLVNDVYTHDMEKLLDLAELRSTFLRDAAARPRLRASWNTVKDWTEASRYDIDITEQETRELYVACTARWDGILGWVRRQW